MKISSILVVNMNYLGDALMTTPAIRALKNAFEDVRIDVVAGSTASYGALEILQLDPDVDRFIPRASGGSFARGLQLFRIIKANNYDLVVVLPSIPFYNFIAQMAAKNVVVVPKADESKHMADHMLDCISRSLSLPPSPRSLVISVPEKASQFATAALKNLVFGNRLVVLNLGASRPQKRWPAEHFASTARLAINAGYNLALVGGDNPQDKATADVIMRGVVLPPEALSARIVNLVGKTTLDQLSAVIQAGSVLVTADTGAMHIASALHVPMIALFGSTSAHFTGPYGPKENVCVLDLHLSCAPCGTHPTCNGAFDCMRGITPEQVLASILTLTNLPEGIAVHAG